MPANYDGSVEVPLLLDFHPLNSGSDYQSNNSGTAEVADREGFLVAYPQGIDGTWNFGPCCTESRTVDDVAFARAVVDDIRGEGCVAEKRVYATGYSNGGGMAYKLACDAADQFAAVAPAAFDMTEEMSCEPS
ncbi:MAG: PHB depolymerase family esterase, partial [Pontimonas sp.]